MQFFLVKQAIFSLSIDVVDFMKMAQIGNMKIRTFYFWLFWNLKLKRKCVWNMAMNTWNVSVTAVDLAEWFSWRMSNLIRLTEQLMITVIEKRDAEETAQYEPEKAQHVRLFTSPYEVKNLEIWIEVCLCGPLWFWIPNLYLLETFESRNVFLSCYTLSIISWEGVEELLS